MITAIKLYYKQFKTKVLAVLWLLSIAGAIWVTYNLVTGLEAKKQAKALEAVVKQHNKITVELREFREKSSRDLEKAQGEILFLEGVKLENENNSKDCNNNSALFEYIKLRRNIQKELASM